MDRCRMLLVGFKPSMCLSPTAFGKDSRWRFWKLWRRAVTVFPTAGQELRRYCPPKTFISLTVSYGRRSAIILKCHSLKSKLPGKTFVHSPVKDLTFDG